MSEMIIWIDDNEITTNTFNDQQRFDYINN